SRVGRVAKRTGRDCQPSRRPEFLDRGDVAVETRSDSCDRIGMEPMRLVDALTEPRDREPARHLAQVAVLRVADEQAGRIGAEVDGCDSHRAPKNGTARLTVSRASRSAPS